MSGYDSGLTRQGDIYVSWYSEYIYIYIRVNDVLGRETVPKVKFVVLLNKMLSTILYIPYIIHKVCLYT